MIRKALCGPTTKKLAWPLRHGSVVFGEPDSGPLPDSIFGVSTHSTHDPVFGAFRPYLRMVSAIEILRQWEAIQPHLRHQPTSKEIG